MPPKRVLSAATSADARPAKKSRKATAKATEPPQTRELQPAEWPEYFQSLFKVFKAINMVLTFVSSKRHLATSFTAVRSSVEGVLKRPLEISKVSEIKALLPELVRFSYIPLSDLQQLEESKKSSSREVDYSISGPSVASMSDSGHVLVLDFEEKASFNKKEASGSSLNSGPATLSPAATKKLIEARNERFLRAVNELLCATPAGEHPVNLLVTAGRSFVPIDHSIPAEDVNDIKDAMHPKTSGPRPPMNQIIHEISQSVWYQDQIVHRRFIDAKAAQTASLDPPLSNNIANAVLNARNIKALYSHQVAAVEAVRKGKHVVVSTSTASGKSVIYQIPLLTFLEEDPYATAMLVFPTKALAQDQKASLQHILSTCLGLEHIKVETYDGDTPRDVRTEIRDTASVILTNFDTLHASILPNEERWRSFLKRLKILAVDELHYYTGLFGSHVAYILRRFRRICAAIGNRRIRFISCSATLANPAEYMSKMFALQQDELEVVCNDGAPSGSKEYLIWNPPLVDEMEPSLGRKSSLNEASRLMRFLMKQGVRVILFCKIRKICELAMKTVKADLSNEGRQDIIEKIRAYRGGYSREDRRKIEHEAFSGQLLGIIATNALELGIDIGALDAVIMLGFPMTISNFKQQAGRAGRRSQDSLAVLVSEAFPIDQHFVKHPDELFETSLDDLIIDIDNEMILEAHLQCAGYEMPITAEDEKWFGPLTLKVCEKSLQKDADGWYHAHPKFLPFPSSHVSIRGAQEDTYMVVEIKDDGVQRSSYKLEEVEFSRALFELYEGGVFMHQGESFIIKEISHDQKLAKVVRTDVNYITSPRDFTRVLPLQTFKSVPLYKSLVEFGRVNVCVKVFGFFKIKGGNILDAVELMTPPWERETTGFWIDVPRNILQRLSSLEIDGAAAIHAAEHAFLNQFHLSTDVKTDCRVAKEDYSDANTPAVRPPRLVFYDAAGKTGGIVSRAFEHVHSIFNRAQETVNNCPCEDGCSLCVQSATCKDANLISSKLGAAIILNGLLDENVQD